MKINEIKKQTKKKNKILVMLVFCVILTTYQIFNSYSKYYSQVRGEAATTVASWNFLVNDNEKTLTPITLALTEEEEVPEKLRSGKIAPGTSGSFDIKIDATGAETAIRYTVTFGEVTGGYLPRNLIFKVEEKVDNEIQLVPYSLSSGFSGVIDANISNKVITKTIYWEWPFDSDGAGSNEKDNEDTIDGKLLTSELGFPITIEGIQVE